MKIKMEYMCMICVTVLHGILTYCKLGSMPYIALEFINKVSITAFCIWAIYGAIVFMIAQKWVAKEKRKICIAQAIVFGICIAILKGGIDFITARLTTGIQSSMIVVVIDGVVTFLFGIVLMSLAVCTFAKQRKLGPLDKIKIELSVTAGVIALYIIMVGAFFWQNAQAIKKFSASAEEIQNLDFYFAVKIADGNVCFYVLFYIVFWHLLRKATQVNRKAEPQISGSLIAK